MPKTFDSIGDVKTNKPRLAGYLIDIGADGKPAVRCAIDPLTYELIREDAAEAVAEFQYWPDDATVGKPAQFIHVQSGLAGLKIPSVLPRTTDPLCEINPAGTADGSPVPVIHRPKGVFPERALAAGEEGFTQLILRVADTGAVKLICRATGDNSEPFKMGAYYFAAQFRFAAQPGREPFNYTLTVNYKIAR